ncbi:MAG TPA: cytochrome P450 [Deltaproteobacteria bacterium]|nr:cytochrome P450 [Deltaproteobacteria bacterium]
MTVDDVDVDYLDASAWGEGAHDRMRWLRQHAPVYRAQKSDLWVVSKYEDIVGISKDPETFCSGQGIRPGIPVRQALIDEDDPKHCRLRHAVNRGFTPRRVKLLEEKFEAITRDAIDAVAGIGHCDFVEAIAVPLPLILIAEMIGIPNRDHRRFHAWSDAMMRADGHYDDEEIMARAGRAALEYSVYIKEIIEARRREPQEDLISSLVAADDEGLIARFDLDPDAAAVGMDREEFLELANDELVMVLVTLMVAGNETTRNALSGAVEMLIRNPGIRDRLVAKPELIPDAVEELLRHVSPVHAFARTATRDTELRGQAIREGEKVLMLYPSANRDEEVFDRPDEIRIDRRPDHLAFGIGHHYCMGANLARMELRVALREILRRMPDLRFADAGPVVEPHALVRSCTRMEIEFTKEDR